MKQNTAHFNTSYKATRRYDKALRSIYNELVEINFTDDVCSSSPHTDGKHCLFCNGKETFSKLLQKTAEQTIHPADKERFLDFFNLAKIKAIIESGAKSIKAEFRKTHSDDKYHNFAVTLIPLEKNSLKDCFLCCCVDTSNKEQLEQVFPVNQCFIRKSTKC